MTFEGLGDPAAHDILVHSSSFSTLGGALWSLKRPTRAESPNLFSGFEVPSLTLERPLVS